jgi:hypothetical protein
MHPFDRTLGAVYLLKEKINASSFLIYGAKIRLFAEK